MSAAAVEHIFRRQSARIVAGLASATGDLELAQDAVQEAFVLALERWPAEGVPLNPAGWITTTAKRKAIDHLRRDGKRSEKLALIEALERQGDSTGDDRDRVLGLLFACCHPALTIDARVALTLRTICGLSTSAVARALLLQEPALAKRLVRTRARIRMTGIALEIPPPERLQARLDAVLAVIYLAYNEGHSASDGPTLRRDDLALEAIGLGELLNDLMPREPEVMGLLALMRLNHARRRARVKDGKVVLLVDQDRSLWAHHEIAAARRLLERAATLGGVGQYWLQAAIALEHCIAPSAAATDWQTIVRLYDQLVRLTRSPVVRLNRAIAVAELHGPEAALADLEPLRPMLDDYPYLHAATADMHRRLRRWGPARAAYERAIALTANPMRQAALAERLTALPAEAR
jgi:RNA polymerase sigma-70 factor (ECF subfamily)